MTRLIVLGLTVVSLLAACGSEGEEVLLVTRGETVVEADVITMQTDRVEWFSELPFHDAGFFSADGLDGTVGNDWMPNAALIGDNVDLIIELTSSSFSDGRLQFTYSHINGDVPSGSVGVATLFIDNSCSSPHGCF